MIRFTLTYLKPVALFLSIVFPFQCCKVYDMHPVNIDEVAASDNIVKIIFDDGENLVYDRIYYKDDCLLYGVFTKLDSDRKPIKMEVLIPEKK